MHLVVSPRNETEEMIQAAEAFIHERMRIASSSNDWPEEQLAAALAYSHQLLFGGDFLIEEHVPKEVRGLILKFLAIKLRSYPKDLWANLPGVKRGGGKPFRAALTSARIEEKRVIANSRRWAKVSAATLPRHAS